MKPTKSCLFSADANTNLKSGEQIILVEVLWQDTARRQYNGAGCCGKHAVPYCRIIMHQSADHATKFILTVILASTVQVMKVGLYANGVTKGAAHGVNEFNPS